MTVAQNPITTTPPASVKTKVAILARVSTADGRQSTGRQISDLKSLTSSKGWELTEIIEAQISATKNSISKRGDLNRVFELIDAGEVDKILVTEITRIGRRVKDIRFVIEYAKEHGVSFYIQTLNIETMADNSPMMQMAVNIVLDVLTQLAEAEAKLLSERIRSGMKEARRKGKKIGRPKGKQTKADFAEKIKTNSKYKTAARKLRAECSLREAASYAGISVNTCRKIKKAIGV